MSIMCRSKKRKEVQLRMKEEKEEKERKKEHRLIYNRLILDEATKFVKQFSNEMEEQGEMFRLRENQKDILIKFHCHAMRGNLYQQSLKDITSHIMIALSEGETSVTYKHYQPLNYVMKNVICELEAFKINAFLIKALKFITPLVNDMTFTFEKYTKICISWENIPIKVDDIIRCRSYTLRKNGNYRPLNFEHLETSADVVIFSKLVNERRKELHTILVDGFKQITGVLECEIEIPDWDNTVSAFCGTDDDFRFVNSK